MRRFHIHFSLVNGLKDGRKVTDRQLRLPCYRPEPIQASPGEVLYVAEAFVVHRCRPEKDPKYGRILYRSDGKHCPECGAWTKHLSPRHMPEQLSRYVIQIDEIQEQTLQEITDLEVIEEGMIVNEYGFWVPNIIREPKIRLPGASKNPIQAYSFLWDWTHEPYGPFWCDHKVSVWVFRFHVVEYRQPITDLSQIENLEEFLTARKQGGRPPKLHVKQ